MNSVELELRLASIERSLRRTRLAASLLTIILVAVAAVGFRRATFQTADELKTRRLVVVDDHGIARVVIGQDPENAQRRSRAAGITIHDKSGNERGGLSTFDDGSVVMALDAPVGVGSPMRDRVGVVVYGDGSSHVMLLDNETRAVAKLVSDGKGDGGVQVFKWDMSGKKVHVKTFKYDGATTEEHSLGGP